MEIKTDYKGLKYKGGVFYDVLYDNKIHLTNWNFFFIFRFSREA